MSPPAAKNQHYWLKLNGLVGAWGLAIIGGIILTMSRISALEAQVGILNQYMLRGAEVHRPVDVKHLAKAKAANDDD